MARRGGRWTLIPTTLAAALVLLAPAGCGTPTSPPGSPSGTPTTTTPTASTLPAPPTDFPWVASVTTAEATDQPHGDAVWVTTDAAHGRTVGGTILPAFTKVDEQADSRTQLLGWFGAGRRTLVWATGQDLTSLRSATFSATGKIVGSAAPLRIPGVVTTYGYGFTQPDGSLAWVRLTRTQPAWELVVLDADLHVTARYAVPLSGEGTPQFATATSVGVRTSPTRMSVWIMGIGTTEAELPAECAEETAGTPPLVETGGSVTMRCGAVLVDLDSLMSGPAPVSTWPPVPDSRAIVGAWSDPDGLLWTSSGTGADVRTWKLSPTIEHTWLAAPEQGVLVRAYAGGLSLAMMGDPTGRTLGTWRSETAPAVQVAPSVPGAGSESLVIAVRTTG